MRIGIIGGGITGRLILNSLLPFSKGITSPMQMDSTLKILLFRLVRHKISKYTVRISESNVSLIMNLQQKSQIFLLLPPQLLLITGLLLISENHWLPE